MKHKHLLHEPNFHLIALYGVYITGSIKKTASIMHLTPSGVRGRLNTIEKLTGKEVYLRNTPEGLIYTKDGYELIKELMIG